MSELNKKITDVLLSIKEVGKIDQGIENILMDGFSLSLRTIQQIVNKKDKDEIDLDSRLDMVSNALGFPLEDLVAGVLSRKMAEWQSQQMQGQQIANGNYNPNKEVDSATLDFILNNSDLDEAINKDAALQNDDDIRNIVNTAKVEENTIDSSGDDYEKFLKKARDDLSFLKTQI